MDTTEDIAVNSIKDAIFVVDIICWFPRLLGGSFFLRQLIWCEKLLVYFLVVRSKDVRNLLSGGQAVVLER